MKIETKIRNALIKLYWAAHDDGRLCEMNDEILEHIKDEKWAKRRASVINETLQKLNLPNKARSRRVPRRGAKV